MRCWRGGGRVWLCALTLLTLAGCTVRVPMLEAWTDGERHGRWRVVYTGYGTVGGNDELVELAPATARHDQVTHGALVVTAKAPPEGSPFEVSITTARQLRPDGPNPWEVAWVLWNHTDDDHFYAVALKPNGWEVSKQDPAYPGSQRYLVTGSTPTFPIGRTYRVRVEPGPTQTVVSVDGRELATFTDTERPYSSGAIGLYTEDAHVFFGQLRIEGTSSASVRRDP